MFSYQKSGGGTDSLQWQLFLPRYGTHSARLRDGVAALTRRMTNKLVGRKDISALLANRLIALDKCPGVRPIGIGECLHRIICKTMALVTGRDVEVVCGVEQLATGLKSGIEGAVHGMTALHAYDEFCDDGWDSSSLIEAALWNAWVLWPRCRHFLFNTYRGYAKLIVRCCDEFLYSREGVTKGDPMSMLMYSIAVMPLIKSISCKEKYLQCWYADNSDCAGKLSHIHSQLNCLLQLSPAYGYFAESTKSFLVVTKQYEEEAKELFKDHGVIVVSGHRFLGGVIGDKDSQKSYIHGKVDGWVKCAQHLSHAATKTPQAVFTSMTKSLLCEWGFIQRVVPCRLQ